MLGPCRLGKAAAMTYHPLPRESGCPTILHSQCPCSTSLSDPIPTRQMSIPERFCSVVNSVNSQLDDRTQTLTCEHIHPERCLLSKYFNCKQQFFIQCLQVCNVYQYYADGFKLERNPRTTFQKSGQDVFYYLYGIRKYISVVFN